MNVALIPVKRLSAGKSRLLPKLRRDELERLTLAMLEDIISALRSSRRVERIAVVTPDPEVAERSERLGAEALLRPDPGLNESIDDATKRLALAPEDRLLVVLGDVAGVRAEEIDALFTEAERCAGACALIAPSRDGGTAALLRCPPGAIATAFGGDSAARHRAAAAAAGVAWRELELPSLATDLDCAEDVERFLASDTGGTCTRAALEAFDWEMRA